MSFNLIVDSPINVTASPPSLGVHQWITEITSCATQRSIELEAASRASLLRQQAADAVDKRDTFVIASVDKPGSWLHMAASPHEALEYRTFTADANKAVAAAAVAAAEAAAYIIKADVKCQKKQEELFFREMQMQYTP